jgi:hypothetical protein
MTDINVVIADSSIQPFPFTGLTDAPSDYTDKANQFVIVKSTEDGVDFTSLSTTFKVAVSSSDTTPEYLYDKVSSGPGISISKLNSGSDESLEISNSLPDQTVTLTAGTGINITGSYPDFTIVNTGSSSSLSVLDTPTINLELTSAVLSGSVIESGLSLNNLGEKNYSSLNGTPTIPTTTAEITSSIDRRYITDSQKIVISNTSGINTGDQYSSDFDHNNLTNTHNITSDISHSTISNTHNLTTDINHNSISDTHNLTSDIDHTLISNIGTNSHIQIDSHINDSTIHFLTSDIIHNELTNGIQGGTTNQYYHLNVTQHTNLTNNAPSFTNSVSTPIVYFNSNDTYFKYNTDTNSIELFVNGTKFAEWGG